MPLTFRRKPAEPAAVPEPPEDETSAAARARSQTQSKRALGQSTPKRRSTGRTVEPPPANRREALKRLREKDKIDRAERRQAIVDGKEEFLPARDKGPERALVRDIVDSRTNIGDFVLLVLIIVLVTTFLRSPVLTLGANLFFYLYVIAVVVDSTFLVRRVKRILSQRFPKSKQSPRSHYFYAILRSLNFRRMRLPKPKVKPGDKI